MENTAFDPTLLLLLLIALLRVVWLLYQSEYKTESVPLTKNPLRWFSIQVLVLMLLPMTLQAKELDGLYIGAGIGVSHLQPDVTKSRYSVDKDNALSKTIILGYDINSELAIELQYSDLGKVKLKPKAAIAYTDKNISGLYQFYKADKLSLFARLGLGEISNSSSINVEQFHNSHWLMGAGASYTISKNLALRVDWTHYDQDAAQLALSMLYHVNLPNNTMPVAPLKGTEDKAQVQLIPVTVKPDESYSSIKPFAVQEVSKYWFQVEHLSLYFKFASTDVPASKHSKLKLVKEWLESSPQRLLLLTGHTDNIGDDAYNMNLSLRRAIAVRDFLEQSGIPRHRMRISARGEKLPVAGNSNQLQRAMNRRVVVEPY